MEGAPRKHKRSAAERRAQQERADARMIQRMAKMLTNLNEHRGNRLTKFGQVLMQAMTAAQTQQPRHQNHAEDKGKQEETAVSSSFYVPVQFEKQHTLHRKGTPAPSGYASEASSADDAERTGRRVRQRGKASRTIPLRANAPAFVPSASLGGKGNPAEHGKDSPTESDEAVLLRAERYSFKRSEAERRLDFEEQAADRPTQERCPGEGKRDRPTKERRFGEEGVAKQATDRPAEERCFGEGNLAEQATDRPTEERRFVAGNFVEQATDRPTEERRSGEGDFAEPETVRPTEERCRFGEEDLAKLATDRPKEEFAAKAERLREALLKALKEAGDAAGLNVQEATVQLREDGIVMSGDEQAVEAMMQQFVEDGDAYNTIDDYHFAPT
eukprot:TRINITY_DN4435_c0_g1_i1.p1 TRINITY_DN4435_c0_g1~~TRINITY_DN4435_c0_g1_i1.p1  ORF type:complete len:403 (+),score=106.20 TRINITY_DN4435_c0_g1_i1:53-1210(+)